MPPGKQRYTVHVRTSWQHSPALSGVSRLQRAALLQRSVNLLSPALLCWHVLWKEHLQHPALPCRAEEQENPWAAGAPHQRKITGVQPSSNSHRNYGDVLVKARLGCDSATFSLKKRCWSLELAVAVDQQTESTKSRTHIRVRIITGTSRNPRTI